MLLCGALLFLFQVAFLFGVGETDATLAALSILLVPTTTLVATAALGWEPLSLSSVHSWAKLLGIACACWGCALVVLRPTSAITRPDVLAATDNWSWGSAVLFMSGVGTAAFALSQRPLLHYHSADEVMAATYCVAAAASFVCCAAWAVLRPDPAVFSLNLHEAEALVFTVVFASCAAFVLFSYANSLLPATLVTLYGILQPLLTSCFAYATLGETPSPGTLCGALLIVLGLMLMTLGPTLTLTLTQARCAAPR